MKFIRLWVDRLTRRGGCWLRAFGQVLMLCRFSTLSLLVAGMFLFFVPQGQEVLLKLASASLLSQVLFMLAAIAWALSIWYWPRVLMSFNFANWPPPPAKDGNPQPAMTRSIAKVLPRALGTSALFVIAAALFKAVSLSESGAPEHRALLALAITSVVMTLLFGVFVIYRRDFFKGHFAGKQVWAFNEEGITYSGLCDLKQTKWTIFALSTSLVATAVLFLLFSYRPANLVVAPYLGAATIVLAATASWVPIGSLFVYLGQRWRFPVLGFLIIYVIGVSSLNDNHRVARLEPVPPASAQAREARSVKEHFESWVGVACKGDQAGNECPIYIVAAEGGGIRAAYWTASVLGRLQDVDSTFSSHLYVISGVSGGSVGAAVFDALVASDLNASGCQRKTGDPSTNSKSYAACAQAMLSRDFLAPTLGTMLYPDLFQRFLFWPIDYFDRGRTLEETWEDAWRNIMPNKIAPHDPGFGTHFDNLWLGSDRQYRVPALIFNSTQVETGRRVLLSNLPVGAQEFADVADLRKIFSLDSSSRVTIPMALSTAANGSARFTYVSPAGKVEKEFHIVDGGYFENSGSSSALEVMTVINQYKKAHPEMTIVPVVIHISNEPALERIYTRKCVTDATHFGSGAGNRILLGSETLSPVVTLYNTRGARAVYATEALARAAISNGGRFFHFGLSEDAKGQLPLGWSLSDSATNSMRKQMQGVSLANCS